MKFIITESQYASYRKSLIRMFLRRVGRRIDEIMENSITDTLNWYGTTSDNLHNVGPNAFTDIIIDDVWQYVYESYIEPDVEFGDEDQDIIRDYLFERYSYKIKEMYNSHVGRDLNESEDKGRNKIEFFQELIDETLKYIKVGCDKPYDEFPQDISFDNCDDAEIIRYIEVMDTKFGRDGKYLVEVRVKYSSIREHVDMGEILYDIGELMRKKTGIKFWIRQKENINTNTNRQW